MRAAILVKGLGYIALLGALAGVGYLGWRALDERTDDTKYRLAKVERGSLVAIVTAAGTINAAGTVQVGAAVTGQINAVYADFNSEVRRNQVLARVDPEAFEIRVAQAQADAEAARTALAVAVNGVAASNAEVARARVLAVEAEREVERKRALAERGFIAPAEADKAEGAHEQALEQIKTAEARVGVREAQVENARATVRQREAVLAQARADLDRTYVRAPVDGTIISRAVDAGQTVAARSQASTLFTIARDLREMQVEAPIDEDRIGRLRAGQAATFTVDAFPRRNFEGRVVQIRKAPQVLQSVVTYTVVVSAPNADLVLLPGMTANVRIVTDSRMDVLKVPNAALRFRPRHADSWHGGAESSASGNGVGHVWQLDAVGRPRPVEVRTGVSDGASTEIAGGVLGEGAEVIVGILPPPPAR